MGREAEERGRKQKKAVVPEGTAALGLDKNLSTFACQFRRKLRRHWVAPRFYCMLHSRKSCHV